MILQSLFWNLQSSFRVKKIIFFKVKMAVFTLGFHSGLLPATRHCKFLLIR